jgi:hypothetical protein
MKAFILTSILITGLTVISFGKPIKDIYSIKEPILTEESYVNDIPFNTWDIAVDAMLKGDEAKLAEEPYANDIPFNTREIACKALLKKMVETSGEINIDDIPFNTNRIYCELLAARITREYRNEQNTQDLPERPDYIICTYDAGVPSCVAVKGRNPKRANFTQKKLKKSDYTIIYPVRMDKPGMSEKNDMSIRQVFVDPGFSL